MKKGYIPKDQRKKILLMCDDIRTHSGIGTVAKEIVIHTAPHFNWVQLGAAIDHPEAGKVLDISAATNGKAGIEDSDVKIIPFNGYGNPDMSGIDNESETWPKVIEAYNELFEDSFQADQEAFNNSLEMWGNFSEVWRWLPELSSPAVSIN